MQLPLTITGGGGDKALPQVEIMCHDKWTPHCVLNAATLLKTELGSVPDGKVKIRLESDGSLLDVDEDDVEKVLNHQISSALHQLQMALAEYVTSADFTL